MEKSIFSHQYAILLKLLRSTRQVAGLTQFELADKLEKSQSFISKTERGETRLDVLQLRTICQALGKSLVEFVQEFESELEADEKGSLGATMRRKAK